MFEILTCVLTYSIRGLIPKEDMEITIMFYGSEKSITEASEQIEKIIASVK